MRNPILLDEILNRLRTISAHIFNSDVETAAIQGIRTLCGDLETNNMGIGHGWSSGPHVVRFSVTGNGDFPLDMLRYDQAWPASPEDAAKISRRFDPSDNFGVRRDTVELCRLARKWREGPCVPRWASFGWAVDRNAYSTPALGEDRATEKFDCYDDSSRGV